MGKKYENLSLEERAQMQAELETSSRVQRPISPFCQSSVQPHWRRQRFVEAGARPFGPRLVTPASQRQTGGHETRLAHQYQEYLQHHLRDATPRITGQAHRVAAKRPKGRRPCATIPDRRTLIIGMFSIE